jgi:hypothetical protein
MRVDNRVTQVPPSKLMKPDTMKLPVAARQMADATAPVGNNNQIPTALGPQLEDPPKPATAKVAPTPTAVELVAVMVAAAASAEAHHMALAEELVAAVITEAEAMRTTTLPASHVAATMPTTGLRRSAAKRLLKQVTTTTSPPTPLDFAICSSSRNSSLSGSPSTTRGKTQYSGLGARPYPLKILVVTTTRSASTSSSA